MTIIILSIVALVFGFALLIWSADEFIKNGAKVATIFNISPLVIGLVIFGFGTSAPEMLVSIVASSNGNTELAVGNAIGSNIFNIALVLGVSAIISPLKIQHNAIKKELIFLLFVTLVVGLLLWDQYIGFIDGLILISLLILFLVYVFTQKDKEYHELSVPKNTDKTNTKMMYLMLVISLVVLISSAELVVWSGTKLAREIGVSDLIIGLTIVALGTSLPELAVSIAGIIKKQHEIVVGNVIGSNLFNTIGVLAMPGLIHPSIIPKEVIYRDYTVMLLLTFLFFLICYKFNYKNIIGRLPGMLFITVFVFYMYQLF